MCSFSFLYPPHHCAEGIYQFVIPFVTHRNKFRRPHKLYIFLILDTREVDLAMTVCPSVRLSVEIDITPSIFELAYSFWYQIVPFRSSEFGI